ncbi:MAG: lipopolysaccharide transport periplasmic protein LptA [Mariprofundaceae bacterium]
MKFIICPARHGSRQVYGLFLVFAFILVWPVGAGAESVQIESDRLEIIQQRQEAIFSGHVKLRRGNFELNADEVIARYDQGSVTRGITNATANGHVSIRMGDKHGKADQATLDQSQGLVELTGHAEITQKSGTIQGDTIIYKIKEDTINVLQGKSGRVRVHIDSPQVLQQSPVKLKP